MLMAAWVMVSISCSGQGDEVKLPSFASTLAGRNAEFGEPFGVAHTGGRTFITDGERGVAVEVTPDGSVRTIAAGLGTPSGITVLPSGELVIAETGRHTIVGVSPGGEKRIIAGADGIHGTADGLANEATFNGPIGVACDEKGRIFVADTYNDRIRMIEDGRVRTIAGGEIGSMDGTGSGARFDTPTGIAIWHNKLLVADTGNARIRVIEPDGTVWTLAGGSTSDRRDGMLSSSLFVAPSAIAVDSEDRIFVLDGNAVRVILPDIFPTVRTFNDGERGLRDGAVSGSRFSRPSGIAVSKNGDIVVADSENRLVRLLSHEVGTPVTQDDADRLRDDPTEFRSRQPARWPYDPPAAVRDVAGTLGEIRGEMRPGNDQVWFHNGLDIAGSYGETARFVRTEKVLRPVAAENFGSLRELIRMPTLGYIHIRLGRDASDRPFGDPRFQFTRDPSGKLINVRVPRGTEFSAGEPIGTLNPMNHVHLIAGRPGREMNAIDALALPGISDDRAPTILGVRFYDANWQSIETSKTPARIKLSGKVRIVLRAYDQMTGNSERRRLGLFKAGWQLFGRDGRDEASPLHWNITFARMPDNSAVRYVYADGSHSGATGETIFDYIVTNFVNGDEVREEFFDTGSFAPGEYTIRVLAGDHFGNIASKDIAVELIR